MDESEYNLLYTTHRDTMEFEYECILDADSPEGFISAMYSLDITPILKNGHDSDEILVSGETKIIEALDEYDYKLINVHLGGIVRLSTLNQGDNLNNYVSGFNILAQNLGGWRTSYRLDMKYLIREYNSSRISIPSLVLVDNQE